MKRTSKTTGGSRRRSPARPVTGARRHASAVAELLRAFQGVARRLRIRWYVFGAQAVAVYGVPRTTADVDITVMLDATPVAALVAQLDRAGFTLKVADPAFVAETRVLPLHHRASGWDLDVVLGGPGVEELFLTRTRTRSIDGLEVPIIALEDLVATKLLAQRPKDLEDIRGLLRTATELDHEGLRAIVALLEEALGVSDLAPLLARLAADAGRSGAGAPSLPPAARPPRRR